MAVSQILFGVLAVVVFVLGVFFAVVQAQSLPPAPQPTSDGISIDQGIACVLMLVVLVLTYIIHAADISYRF